MKLSGNAMQLLSTDSGYLLRLKDDVNRAYAGAHQAELEAQLAKTPSEQHVEAQRAMMEKVEEGIPCLGLIELLI